MKLFKLFAFIVAVSLLASACSTPQSIKQNLSKDYSPVSKDLFDTIAYHDSIFFAAFNSRNFFSGKINDL